jgi:predicted AAA+ superfamily ATPase
MMVLAVLLKSLGEIISINHLFNILKKQIKISKDKFYTLTKYFEDNYWIFFVQKYNQQKATKKIYAYNHAFLDSLSYHKNIKNELSNMVFLEIYQEYQKDIFYLDNIDFYIPSENMFIVAIPFFNQLHSIKLISNTSKIVKEFHIQKYTIITLNSEFKFDIGNLKCEVLPFYKWALAR